MADKGQEPQSCEQDQWASATERPLRHENPRVRAPAR